MSVTKQEMESIQQKARAEEAWWRFFSSYRLQLADVTANQNLLETELEEQLLPLTFDNLSKLWESFSDQKKATYAKPTSESEVKPRNDSARDWADIIKARAAASKAEPKAEPKVEEKPVVNEHVLPPEYSRRRILVDMPKEEYRALLKKYGKVAVENRVNGVS